MDYGYIDHEGKPGKCVIEVDTEGEKINGGRVKTYVTIMSIKEEKNILGGFVDLCKSLDGKPGKGNSRGSKVGDEGKSTVLGWDKRNGRLYQPTKGGDTAKLLSVLSRCINDFVRQNLPFVWKSIRSAEYQKKIPERFETGGREGLCSVVNTSEDLICSSHHDVNDKSMCVSFWVKRTNGQVKDWYFILPNVTMNGKKGLVIKLFHGCVVSWDGRIIRHCSTVGERDKENHVHGVWFGSSIS